MRCKRTLETNKMETNIANEQTLVQPSPLDHVESFTSAGAVVDNQIDPRLDKMYKEAAVQVGLILHEQNAIDSGKKSTINMGAWKPAWALDKKEHNRVTIPGDIDYVGVWKGTQ
ncbi:MAG: hypothetical protein KAS32_08685 [Candidatus Peribacteraceae bacterium]|nr:hypothetical protein [Candidatus Peribacteraceae bacterium]